MKRMLTFVLALVLVLCLIPGEAAASEATVVTTPTVPTQATLGMRKLEEGEAYQEMTTSQNMLDILMVMEGFSAEPYADVSQWSIGYGSYCGKISDPKPDIVWTQEQAEQELVNLLKENYGAAVNKYCKKIGRQPTQNQFDALVSFTYNLGSSWTSSTNRLNTWLRNPTTELELVNAMGVWGRVNGSLDFVICARRLREAIIFLKGEYSIPRTDPTVETNLPVISDGALPYYKMIIFQANGGTFEGKSDTIRFYEAGKTYESFAEPVFQGYLLESWTITRINGNRTTIGGTLTADKQAGNHLEITANWVVDPNAPPPTEAPTEPTEPEISDPIVTEPEGTVPETNVPDVTDPENTVPETSVPEETDTTEPETSLPEQTDATEPETSEPDGTELTEPEDAAPETSVPAETEPETTVPETTVPETTVPETTVPETTIPEGLPFVDVPEDAWFRDKVEFVYEHGYMSGTSEITFSPGVSMTRAMLVQVLYRIDGSPEVDEEACAYFADTQEQYFTVAVGWAKSNGIVSGVSESLFAPHNNVTRQDAVLIFYRYCRDYLMLGDAEGVALDGFVDRDAVAEYAVEAMEWAVDLGLIAGSPTEEGMALNPRGNLTRAEAATLLKFFVNEIMSCV